MSCVWRWGKHYIERRAVVHLKVNDPNNDKYNEELSDSKLLLHWFEYTDIGEPWQDLCIGKHIGRMQYKSCT